MKNSMKNILLNLSLRLACIKDLCWLDINDLSCKKRYLYLRRNFIVVMLMISMIPLIITAGLSFYRYQMLIQEETVNNARWSTESARQTIEAFLDRLKAKIQMVSDSYTYEYLSNQENLDMIFRKIKQKHSGIVDLSVIDPNGIQRVYSGPYQLTGNDYSDSPWYTNALTKDFYISEVFMGFRRVPHFVIATSRNIPGGSGNWVLRASIDTATLDLYMEKIRSDIVKDAFLVNHNGILQSSSHYYGNVSGEFKLKDIPSTNSVDVAEGQRNDISVLRTYAQIKDTPWILILEHQNYSNKTSWLSFRRQLVFIFISCAILIILITLRVATLLAASIRKADETREAILTKTEHTEKLASIGRLAAGVAHEINNPLAIINEKTGLMKDLLQISGEFAYREKFFTLIDAMQNAVNRSRSITHRLLGFTRRMEAKLEPVQINSVISDVLGFLGKEATYQNIEIEQRLDPDLPSIMSDQGQLQQILLNIINNAIDAVGKGGRILIVSTRIDPRKIRVEIEDNGPGIPTDIQKHIFEPFFTTKLGNDKHGTGLGLSITYALVKKLGGEISLNSKPGIGSTFSIVLPVNNKQVGFEDE